MNTDLIIKLLPLLISGVTQTVQYIHDLQKDLKQSGEMTPAQEKELDDRIAGLKDLPHWRPSATK